MQVQGTLYEQAWRNTFHLWGHDSNAPVEVADLTALNASAWMDGFVTAYRGVLSAAGVVEGILLRQVQDPLNPGDPKNEAFRVVNLAGTVATPANLGPREVSCMIKLNTDAATRSSHGRVFVPTTMNRDDILADDFVAAVVTRTTAIVTELAKLFYTAGAGHAGGAAADWDLAIYSRALRARDADQYGYRVTSAIAPKRIHWLRSRAPRS
jgi:hypothetical protein